MSSLLNELNEITMTPEEHFEVLEQQTKKLEDNFLNLGRLLADIKRLNLFHLKGYSKFKEFVENEYKMSNSLANKLIAVNDIYFNEFGLDEKLILEIGFERLSIIKPMVKNATIDEQDEWLKKAKAKSATDLREEVKDLRKKQKDKSVKQVFTDQFLEKCVTFFNCTNKELMFKLSLFFYDMDLEEVKTKVRMMQRKFEENEL